MHAVITGGAGFIGSHMCEKLNDNNITFTIIDNLFRGKKENIEHLLNKKNDFHQIDLTDHNKISDVAKILIQTNPAYILHYAAINGTEYFYDIPGQVAEVNSIGTYNLMLALRLAKQKKPDFKPLLIFASTSETYGEPFHIPTREEDVTYVRINETRDSYAAAKLMSEFYVKLISEELKIDWIILRIFNVYGPRMVGTKYGQVVPEFVNRLKGGEYPLKILGDGSHTRSFCFVSDHVELTWRLINKGKRNDIYNLGNPEEISIKALGEKIMRQMNLEPKFEFKPERKGDHKKRMPDISKLLGQTGPYTFLSLSEGIDRLLKE